jgi:acetoin utilization deacetylase AcuC-like enzyme
VQQIGLILDPCFEEHDSGAGHPERPARLARVRRDLDDSGLKDRCRIVQPTPAHDDQLRLVHDPDYIRRVVETCETGQPFLDSADTAVCPSSEKIARLAAGSLISLTRAVAGGELDRGFAALRPPGHHAERDRAMGFCLYNNVAVAARNLTQNEGLARVLIVDWDVHHGNGTQHIFEEAPDIFFFSVHQWPLYPGTGAREERGRGKGRGATLNCPLPPGSGDEAFLGTLRDELVEAAEQFRPEFVLVSAGFDAHRADPLANLEVSTQAYAAATRIVCDVAGRFAGGRLVSTLEGGYDLDALGDSVKAHLEVLLES